jgi:hypothetical protein
MMNLLAGGVVLAALMAQTQDAKSRDAAPQRAYQKLFTHTQPVRLGQDREAPRDGQGRGRPERGPCNMPVIPADAAVDPKIVLPTERTNVDAKIRAIAPPACWK